MVDCSFDILTSKWRIFHRPFDTSLEFSDSIIRGCCIYNYFIKNDGICLKLIVALKILCMNAL